MIDRMLDEFREELPSSADRPERVGAQQPLGAALKRRSAMAGALAFSIGCTFVRAASGEQPVLVDGWLILPSDIKQPARD